VSAVVVVLLVPAFVFMVFGCSLAPVLIDATHAAL
jgi:hypothetical protein